MDIRSVIGLQPNTQLLYSAVFSCFSAELLVILLLVKYRFCCLIISALV